MFIIHYRMVVKTCNLRKSSGKGEKYTCMWGTMTIEERSYDEKKMSKNGNDCKLCVI